jgi:hypothetical protein
MSIHNLKLARRPTSVSATESSSILNGRLAQAMHFKSSLNGPQHAPYGQAELGPAQSATDENGMEGATVEVHPTFHHAAFRVGRMASRLASRAAFRRGGEDFGASVERIALKHETRSEPHGDPARPRLINLERRAKFGCLDLDAG